MYEFKAWVGLIIPSAMEWTLSLGQDRGYIKIGSRYPQGV